jgi:hypothetical protein
MGRSRDAGCSTRADLGFTARRAGGRLAGVWSDLGIAAAAGRSATSAKLEPARACFCAAPRAGTAHSRAIVGRPRRAGAGMGRARSSTSTNRAGCPVVGSPARAAGECAAASFFSGGGRTVMGCSSGG